MFFPDALVDENAIILPSGEKSVGYAIQKDKSWQIFTADIAANTPTEVAAGTGEIDRIELLFTDLVTVHFDTEPNRKYELQYTDGFQHGTNLNTTLPIPSGSWSNLFVAPAVPFPNHYVIADTRTNQHRFYRLRATP